VFACEKVGLDDYLLLHPKEEFERLECDPLDTPPKGKRGLYGKVCGVNVDSEGRIEAPDTLEKQPEPEIQEEAFHGVAGDVVHMLEPHTEADPVGLLVSILAEFGAIVGRKPHLILDASYHPLLFYPVLVGNSSKSRKGSSGKRIKALFEKVHPDWTRGKYKGTLSTGEGLCYAVRDEVWEKSKKGEDILSDERVQDKRLFLVQSEFGAVLKTMSREGNSLSGTLRDAWDGESLAPMTKGSEGKPYPINFPSYRGCRPRHTR